MTTSGSGRVTISERPISEQDVLLSGSTLRRVSSARAGYIPVALSNVPAIALQSLRLYVRTNAAQKTQDGSFTLYRDSDIPFTSTDRERLLASGVKFVYISMADQARFREQVELHLERIVTDPESAISAKLALVYDTSVELINELLADPDLAALTPRLERVSRAVTTLTMDDPTAFSHLFATSHHDFYTATHMVNVATYSVPLAYTLGYHSPDELNHLCQAAFLHDIGKLYVPQGILNKTERLSQEDWQLIQRHAELGARHLGEYEGIQPLILRVVREHHERLDGSGYPAGLTSDQIHPFSKICAVVDSFDAMTALRPFKKRTLSVADALEVLKGEAPLKYDAEVVAAWVRLMSSAAAVNSVPGAAPPCGEAVSNGSDRRRHPRYPFQCPTRLHVLERGTEGWVERPAIQVVAHSLSRSGLGVLCPVDLLVDTPVHIYLHARAWNREFLEALIVRCRACSDGWYEIGMEFATLDAAFGAVGQ